MKNPTEARRSGMPRLCGVAFVLIGASTPLASAGQPESIKLAGVIRDFQATDPAFRPDARNEPHVAGLMSPALDQNHNPVFAGSGTVVDAPAVDAAGNHIAPHLAQDTVPFTDFDIVGGHLIPNQEFTARVTLIGAAIETGSYHVPVTTLIRVGTQDFEPYGPFASPVSGNVNDDQTATGSKNTIVSREFDLPGTYAASTAITVDGTSWLRSSGSGTLDSDWNAYLRASSLDDSPQVRVLRHGDPVPNITGAFSQASVGEYVAAYVDQVTQTMRLDSNQAIWLFELGTTSTNSAADFQDLVVLVSLAAGSSAFQSTTTNCGNPIADTPARLGASSNAGIASATTAADWFTTNPSVSVSQTHLMDLTRTPSGMYEFSAPDFTPIDDALFGREGRDHNRSFTFEVHAKFQYHGCADQVFEFSGTGDVWVFINGNLAMDLGGTGHKSQRIEIDRLNLQDGETYRLSFFYVNRRASASPFHIRTNLDLRSSAVHLPPTMVLGD